MQQCKTVTLRTRKCKNGMLSYYLDYYPAFRDKETMQTIRHESLHIYIYEKPKNNIERALNRNLTEKAEMIRCMRYESIVNERFGLYDKAHKKESFLAYFKKLCAKNNQKWDYVYLHFYDYVNGTCTFEEVDVPLCKGFCEYLLDEAVNRRTKEPLSQNSVSGYWSTFRGMLRIAYRDKQIPDNINEFLDKVKTVESPKEVLTLEELYRLYTTSSENELIKRAALFSCLTGLRFSDVQALQWKNVCAYADGGKYLDFISIKTEKQNIVPINKDVEKLMGTPGSGFVFKGLKYEMTQQPMKDWLANAKIQKHITFHCFRHTYASLQVELGTDIYTVQRILAHSNVATTEIYARHAEPKKREAAQKLTIKKLKSVAKQQSNKCKKGKNENAEIMDESQTSEKKTNKRKKK